MEKEGVEGRPTAVVRDARGETDAPFGAKLKTLREAAGLTQEELASRAGVSAKAVSALERGDRKRPYPHTVRSLADALSLSEGQRADLTWAITGRGGDASETAPPSALPASLTPLLGREREVEDIAGLLGRATVRLLTLTGPGGIGKTRLGIEAARTLLVGSRFPGGVAFVALAPLGDAALVVPTISRVLGLMEATGVRPLEVLRQYLREKEFLLVLDNFEHVAEAAPEVVDLLGSCPGLSVLATSRAPLRVRGEREYPVSPLAVPDPNRASEAEEVAETPAAKLFVERAEAASPSFRLTRANAAAVAAICWRLDGLPLALELAAAGARYLGPTALLSRLDHAIQAGGARDLPERQRTMRATLDWSHALLAEDEKILFRRLSVFAGGFTLGAAEEVCATRAADGAGVLVLLGNLVEQSLVLAERDPREGARYRMLEPVRQYALEKLRESGEEADLRRCHAEHYLALAEEAEPRIKGQDQVGWLDTLEADNDNLRAAIGWSLEAGDAGTAARFGWALRMYWVMRTRHGEGRLLMERLIERDVADLPARLRAMGLYGLAVCVYGSGDDERLMEITEESAALFRRVGDRHGEANPLAVTAFAALHLGDLDRANRAAEDSLERFREHGDAWGSAHVLNILATIALRRGDYRRTTELAEEALSLTRRTQDRFAGNVALHHLAQAAWAADDHRRAARYYREALTMAFELADKIDSAYYMQGLAAVAGDEPRRAARLLGAAETLLEAAGLVSYYHASDELHRHAASAAREQLGERAWTEAHGEGRVMGFGEAVAYALGEDAAVADPKEDREA